MTPTFVPGAVRALDLDTLTLESGGHRSLQDGACVADAVPTEAELARFRACCRPMENGCIDWVGSMMWKGYGRFWFRSRAYRAHRFSYELSAGPIGQGLVIDHLCRNRRCVNPLHLEAVTPAENLRRSALAPATRNKAKTHCPKGHPYDRENTLVRTNGQRECRECSRAESRAYKARRRAARRSA